VLNGGSRFTDEEYDVYRSLRKYFHPELFRFIIVVFTHADSHDPPADREKNFERIEELESKRANRVADILKETGNGYVLFGNTDDLKEKKKQAQRLMTQIKVMQSRNDKLFFCDKKTAEETKRREKRLVEIMRAQSVPRAKAFEILASERLRVIPHLRFRLE
jgi:hypothetical protein